MRNRNQRGVWITRRWMSLVALAGIVCLSLPVAPSRAASTIVVNSLADAVKMDGACSLREAIIAANKDVASSPGAGECAPGSGDDVILLPAGTYILSRSDGGSGQEDAASTGDLDIASGITISPTGPVTITTAGRFADRIFHVLSAGRLTLSGVLITNGGLHGDGAGIHNAGWLSLRNVTLASHSAKGRGAGLYNAGTATLANVTLSGNVAGGDGGGVYNTGALSLNNVTIAGNTADSNADGTGDGGGIAAAGGEVRASNTLIAANMDRSAQIKNPDCFGGLNSLGHNLIQNTTGCVITGDTTGNLTGVDALLGPLQTNGGSTPTHALLAGSPAIDAGSPATPGSAGACEVTDQRGVARPRGAACDIGAYESGQPDFPILIRAVPAGATTLVYGWLSSQPNTTFSLRFFASPACDPASLAANPLPGTSQVTTSDSGSVYFQTVVNVAVPIGQFVAARAADARGEQSGFSQCVRAGPGNDSWPRALRLNLSASGAGLAGEVRQFIDQPAESRWFKVGVQPNSKLVVALTELPANYDLTVYKDIATAFRAVSTTQDLLRLGAEFATDAFNPDTFSPDTFSPDTFSPDAFSPDTFSPDTFSPDTFSPDTFSPDTFSPDTFSPDTFSPDAFSPDTFSPDTFSPDTFSPDTFSPDTFSPDTFSGAQSRSLVAVSAFDGTAGEGVIVNTWDNEGDYYIRVRGRNGAFSASAPFHLQVVLATGACMSVTSSLPATSLAAAPLNAKTIILTDMSRMAGSAADKSALQAKLAAFAARPEVAGVVVDVSADARVAAANAQADQFAACPPAKNIVAEAIKAIVTRFRAVNPLEYIVIAGNDNVIPFFRHPDNALLASEKNYTPPVLDRTASQASLKLGYVLSQDDYGSTIDLSLKANTLPVPDLAVGRLVETPAEMIGVLDAYLATTGGVIATPSSALVTGYDFLTDAAEAMTAELRAGLGVAPDTLIAPRDQSPADPAAWTADDLRARLLGARHDLVFLAGHFSANSALAADYRTRLLTDDLISSETSFVNAIVFSAGCHSGYNIVGEHGITGVTREPDWAQAFARKGATLIAGTGYQYGDTDFIEYSERLYLEFARQLRTGQGPVSVGKALVAAKQAYLENTPAMRGIHEKTVLIATLFGLPMLSVNLPGQRITPPSDAPVVSGLTPFTTNPGATLGLRYADLTITPSLTLKTVALDVISSTATVTATYLAGSNGWVSNPAEPVLPREVRNVSVPGWVLRGVGFRGGAYSELSDVLPLLGAPTTELRGVHAAFSPDYWYPVRPWSANYFDALADPTGATRLVVLPAQFRPSSPVSPTGTFRQYSAMNFRLYYSGNTTAYTGSVPALSAAPSIARVESVASASVVTFSMRVLGNPAAGIQQVWVTYGAVDGPWAGRWQSLDLSQNSDDSSLWTGVLSLAATPANDVRYVVQAVNGVGLVSLATNLGAFYVPGSGAEPTLATALSLSAPATSGPYGAFAEFSALLTHNGAPLAGQAVSFGLGPVRRQALTDAAGRATASLPLLATPGAYSVRASFAGTAEYIAASTTGAFTITTQATSLTLAPQPALTPASQPSRLIATLRSASGRLLANKTVFLIIHAPGGDIALSADTGPSGAALFDVPALPPGTQAVNAYFSGNIPLPGQLLTLADESYEPTSTSGTLVATQPPDTRITSGPANPTKSRSATFTFIAMPDPALPVTATFACQLDGQPFAPCAGPVTYSGLVAGAHTFRVRAIDALGVADPTPAQADWVIDTQPPATIASVAGQTPAGCPADCFRDRAVVTLSANEPATTVYRVTRQGAAAGAWLTYTAPFTVAGEGAYTVEFYSTDVAGNVEAVRKIAFRITAFASLPVLDNFNRADGSLGANWGGEGMGDLRIVSNTLTVSGPNGVAYWLRDFGADQAVSVRLVRVQGTHQGLLLKVVQGNWKNGAISVAYDAAARQITVKSFRPGIGWTTLSMLSNITLRAGDLFAAQALANGDIRVYVNCALVGQTADAFFANRGGAIGLRYANSIGAGLDDFSGGNWTP